MQTVHIAGAGLGGMVAAINLARKGRDVLVIDAGRGVGGTRGYHPSIHASPLDLDLVKNYAGVDIRGVVKEINQHNKINLWDHKYVLGKDVYDLQPPMYGIERGVKKTSLDSLLYREAKKLGVKFQFSTFIQRAEELPPGSIIATGLYPEMFDSLKIPYKKIEGYYFCVPEKKENNRFHFWMGNFSLDYYYAVAMNGMYYGLLFQRGQMDYGKLVEFEKMLEKSEGEVYDWRPFTCRVPIKRFRQPRLFAGKYILGGSLTGMMDPLLMFGIHGALLSGRVAAMTVMDPDRALNEFKILTHYYRRAWLMRKVLDAMPLEARKLLHIACQDYLLDYLKRYGYYFRPLVELVDKGIPGFSEGWVSPNIKAHEKEKTRAALFDKFLFVAARMTFGKDISKALGALRDQDKNSA